MPYSSLALQLVDKTNGQGQRFDNNNDNNNNNNNNHNNGGGSQDYNDYANYQKSPAVPGEDRNRPSAVEVKITWDSGKSDGDRKQEHSFHIPTSNPNAPDAPSNNWWENQDTLNLVSPSLSSLGNLGPTRVSCRLAQLPGPTRDRTARSESCWTR